MASAKRIACFSRLASSEFNFDAFDADSDASFSSSSIVALSCAEKSWMRCCSSRGCKRFLEMAEISWDSKRFRRIVSLFVQVKM